MDTRQKILWIGSPDEGKSSTGRWFSSNENNGTDVAIEAVASPVDAIHRMARSSYSGVFLDGQEAGAEENVIRLLQSERILDGMPDGVALVNAEMTVTWANKCLRSWSPLENPQGANFYATLGNPQIMGPDFCPFHTRWLPARRAIVRCRLKTNATSKSMWHR
ncbi:MAG: hypothetical protein R3C56_32670 [Pirellulaceae bacterium]